LRGRVALWTATICWNVDKPSATTAISRQSHALLVSELLMVVTLINND